MDALVTFLNDICNVLIDFFGWILSLQLGALIGVAQYNNFADAPLVEIGWKTVRDVCNMFFILILLIIAIGTIVKWEAINMRQNLRRLVVMALLINFSKTIVVFLIDFSQVIILTFINAVKEFVVAGIIEGLGLSTIVNPTTEGTSTTLGLPEHLIAVIFVAAAALVVSVMVTIFLIRILALWLIIVFSPLAFIASTLPQTKTWYDQWWKQLGSNLTSGPVLAFMLWLTFAFITKVSSDKKLSIWQGFDFDKYTTAGTLESTFLAYIISIGLLMYSIKLAVQMGAAGGAIAQKMAGQMTGMVAGAAKRAGKYVAWGKSGEGGTLGRAKSVLLASGAGIGKLGSDTGMIGLKKLGGMLERKTTVARQRQTETRKKAELDIYGRLTAEQRLRMSREHQSGPARAAIIETAVQKGDFTRRDVRGRPIMVDEQAQEMRRQYVNSGRSEDEMKEFDIKTGLRGLDNRRNDQGELENPEHYNRARELMSEQLPQGLSREMVASFPNLAGEITSFQNTASQIQDLYKKQGPEERQQFMTGIIQAWRDATQIMQQNAIGVAGRDAHAFEDAERRVNRIRQASANMNVQRALETTYGEGENQVRMLPSFNDAVGRMNESSHNDINEDWLARRPRDAEGNPTGPHDNADQVLGLSSGNARRLLTSNTMSDGRKDDIRRIIVEAEHRGDQRAVALRRSLQNYESTRADFNNFLVRDAEYFELLNSTIFRENNINLERFRHEGGDQQGGGQQGRRRQAGFTSPDRGSRARDTNTPDTSGATPSPDNTPESGDTE